MGNLASKLSSRDVVAALMVALEQDTGAGWINGVATDVINAERPDEILRWLGAAPAMREWIGGRSAKRLRDFDYTIRQAEYEATLEILTRELRYDSWQMIQMRIMDLATRANAHWAKLLVPLIGAGASTVCYDDQFFFDTDHSEGDSGTQSNDLSVDVGALPPVLATTEPDSATAYGVKTARYMIEQAIDQIVSFVDDQGEPMNEEASEFLIMCGTDRARVLRAAVAMDMHYAEDNPIASADYSIRVGVTPRLNSYFTAGEFSVFRTNGPRKALVRMEAEGVQVDAVAEGSELEFNEKKHHYGVSAERGVGYGFWQSGVLVTPTT